MYKLVKRLPAGGLFPSPDGRFVCGLTPSRVIVFSAATLARLASFGEVKNAGGVAYTPDGKFMAVKNNTGAHSIYNLDDMCLVKSMVLKRSYYDSYELTYLNDSRMLVSDASYSSDDSLELIDTQTGKAERLGYYKDSVIQNITFVREIQELFIVVFQRNWGDGYSMTYLLRWKYPFDKHEPTQEFLPHRCFERLAYDPNKNYFVYSDLRNLVVADAESMQVVSARPIAMPSVIDVRSPKVLVVSRESAEVLLLPDLPSLWRLEEYLLSGAFSPDGSMIYLDFFDSGCCFRLSNDGKSGGLDKDPWYDQDEVLKLINERGGVDKEILDSAPYDSLANAIFFYALQLADSARLDDDQDYDTAFARIPELYRMVFYTILFERELGNGGASQFLHNRSPDGLKLFRDVLEKLGAVETVAFLDAALELIHKRKRWDYFAAQKFNSRLNKLYDQVSESLGLLLEKYLSSLNIGFLPAHYE